MKYGRCVILSILYLLLFIFQVCDAVKCAISRSRFKECSTCTVYLCPDISISADIGDWDLRFGCPEDFYRACASQTAAIEFIKSKNPIEMDYFYLAPNGRDVVKYTSGCGNEYDPLNCILEKIRRADNARWAAGSDCIGTWWRTPYSSSVDESRCPTTAPTPVPNDSSSSTTQASFTPSNATNMPSPTTSAKCFSSAINGLKECSTCAVYRCPDINDWSTKAGCPEDFYRDCASHTAAIELIKSKNSDEMEYSYLGPMNVMVEYASGCGNEMNQRNKELCLQSKMDNAIDFRTTLFDDGFGTWWRTPYCSSIDESQCPKPASTSPAPDDSSSSTNGQTSSSTSASPTTTATLPTALPSPTVTSGVSDTSTTSSSPSASSSTSALSFGTSSAATTTHIPSVNPGPVPTNSPSSTGSSTLGSSSTASSSSTNRSTITPGPIPPSSTISAPTGITSKTTTSSAALTTPTKQSSSTKTTPKPTSSPVTGGLDNSTAISSVPELPSAQPLIQHSSTSSTEKPGGKEKKGIPAKMLLLTAVNAEIFLTALVFLVLILTKKICLPLTESSQMTL